MGDSIYGQGQEETKITVGEIRRTIDSISSEIGEKLYEINRTIKCFKMSLKDLKEDICL